ncbi:MAG: hypothetical protein JNJ83_11020 [Verrucomicrobiaceae bacterium]|nr:hypothetical protein [Verrucomicrobiaceae bacterium]
MAYLSNAEQQTVTWFRELELDGKGHCEAMRIDPLGSIVIALKPDASDEARAWLAYVHAQASSKGASVNDYLPEHGTLVLVLPRYVRPKQETFSALEGACSGGHEGRQRGERSEQGSLL